MRPLHLILHQRKQDKEIKPPTVAAKLHSWRQSFYSISNFGNVLLVIVYRIKSHREVMKLLLKVPRTRKGRNLVSEEKWDKKRKFFLRQFWFKIDSISTISRLSKALNPPKFLSLRTGIHLHINHHHLHNVWSSHWSSSSFSPWFPPSEPSYSNVEQWWRMSLIIWPQ